MTGWVVLDPPGDAELLAELAADEYLRAVRPITHDLPDPNWVTRPQVHADLERLDELGLQFEVLTRTEHLPALLRRASARRRDAGSPGSTAVVVTAPRARRPFEGDRPWLNQ